jgi:predicted acylesterase/phospholipase RssA
MPAEVSDAKEKFHPGWRGSSRLTGMTRHRWTARLVLDQVLDIIQTEVVRLRARTHLPDLFLMPAVGHIGPLEFYRAREAIAAGRDAAMAHLKELKSLQRQVGQTFIPLPNIFIIPGLEPRLRLSFPYESITS